MRLLEPPPHENPARRARVLAGQLDLLALAGTRVAAAVEALAPTALAPSVARALAEVTPPPPRSALPTRAATTWPPPPARMEAVPVFERPAVTPTAPTPVGAADALQAYVERLLDPAKRTFATRLLPWVRGGSVGDPPAFADIRGMTNEKALDVQRRMEMLAAPKPQARRTAAPPPTVAARPSPTSPAGRPTRKPTSPKQRPEPPAKKPRAASPEPTPPARPSPLRPVAKPLVSSWSDETPVETAARVLPTPDRTDYNRGRHGRAYGQKRLNDAEVVLAREKLLQECADAEAAVRGVVLPESIRPKVEAGVARCEELREAPFPWYGQRGRASDAMSAAWRDGKLYFDVGTWLWHAGKVRGSNAALVFQAATTNKPYPLSTPEEIGREIEAWNDTIPAVHMVPEAQQETARAARAARGLELARKLNAASSVRTDTSFSWSDPRTGDESYLHMRIPRASKVDDDALAYAFNRALASVPVPDDANEPRVVSVEQDTKPERPYTGLRMGFSPYSGTVNGPTGDRRRGAGKSPAYLAALAAAVVRELRQLGYAATVPSDESPHPDPLDPSKTPEPGPKNVRWPGTPDAKVTLVIGRENLGLWSKDRAALVEIAERLRDLYRHNPRNPVSEPVKVGGLYRVDARTRSEDDRLHASQLGGVAVQVDPGAFEEGYQLLRSLRSRTEVDSSKQRLERGPTEWERRRGRTPYLFDVWLQGARTSMQSIIPDLLANFAQLKRFDPTLDRAVLLHTLALAKDPARPWAGLRAGSKASRAVGEAIDRGALKPKEYGETWVYAEGKGVTALHGEGESAWEAFKAAGAKVPA